MIGEKFIAPINHADFVEGVIKEYNEDTGRVVLIADDGELWSDYDYQLEPIIY